MATKTNGNGAVAELIALERQAEALRVELAKVNGQRVNMLDVEARTAHHTKRLGLESTLAAIDHELVAARRAVAAEQAVALAAEQAERNTMTRAALEAAIKVAWSEAQKLDGLVDAVRLAFAEYQRAGGYSWGPAFITLSLGASIAQARAQLGGDTDGGRRVLGWPPAPTSQELAVNEAEDRLRLARERLAWAKALPALAKESDSTRAKENITKLREDEVRRAKDWLERCKSGRWPEPGPLTNQEYFGLVDRLGSEDAARVALGLPVEPRPEIPPVPRE